MSSILTNNSAMVALQTLNAINKNMQTVQDQISTGKAVGSAKDNSAVWAISSVMQSDVEGFKAISESLSLGASTVAVGRQASETVTDLLTEIKGKIVSAQESNVDRAKIQTDITSLRDQINSVVNTAQFNGLNLLRGRDDVNVLSSLDRASDGSVTSRNITVTRENLETTAGTFGTGTDISSRLTASDTAATNTGNSATVTIGGTVAENDTASVVIGGQTISVDAGSGDDATAVATALQTAIQTAIDNETLTGIAISRDAAELTVTSTNAFSAVTLTSSGQTDMTVVSSASEIAQRAETVTFPADADSPIAEGDSFRVTVGDTDFDYISQAGDTYTDVATALRNSITAAGIEGVSTALQTGAGGVAVLAIDNSGASSVALAVAGAEDGIQAGGLRALNDINVSTADGASNALAAIEGLIQTSINAAADFGSVERRIDIQNDFVGKLSDGLKAGIGALVDANMEETSARLQALQVQQQLGTQALSIANQAPQNILSLFR